MGVRGALSAGNGRAGRSHQARPGLAVAIAALLVACQPAQESQDANAADAEPAADAASNDTAAAAPAVPHPVTMEPDPANQTGPVARDVDADFPEPCQAYVRETQACLGALDGPEAVTRSRALRLELHSHRGTWLRVGDRSGLTNICRDHLGMLRETRREFAC